MNITLSEPPYDPDYYWDSPYGITRLEFLRLVQRTIKRLDRIYVYESPKLEKLSMFADVASYGVFNPFHLATIFNVTRQTIYNWYTRCKLDMPPSNRISKGQFQRGAIDLLSEIVKQRTLGLTPTTEMKLLLLTAGDRPIIARLSGYNRTYLRRMADKVEEAQALEGLSAWSSFK